MNADEQVFTIREINQSKMKKINDIAFRMKVAAVINSDISTFKHLFSIIETTSSVAELSLQNGNVKRALKYSIILWKTTDELMEKTEIFHKQTIEKNIIV